MKIPEEIPKEMLSWREGDKINPEHRKALAIYHARTFRLPVSEETKFIKQFEEAPESFVAEALALMIAVTTEMSVDTFYKTFPKTAQNSNSLSMAMFLQLREKNC